MVKINRMTAATSLGAVKMEQPPWNRLCCFSSNTHLPCGPTRPLLEVKSLNHRKICTWVPIAVLFIICKNGKQSRCPPTGNWRQSARQSYTGLSLLSINREMKITVTWMSLRNMSLNKDVCVTQLCLTLCDLHGDCNPPGSSVLGNLQARTLEWVAISFSRGSSQPMDWTQVSRIAGRFFTISPPKEDLHKRAISFIQSSKVKKIIYG